jgi:hypothetical protein
VEKINLGYPKLAAFLDSDENFMLYRRFGYLQSRLLLEKQDELRVLEEKLDKMDEHDFDDDTYQLTTREGQSDERIALKQEAEVKFKEYGKLDVYDAGGV